MIKIIQRLSLLLFFVSVLWSCGGNDDTDNAPEPDNTIHKPIFYEFGLTPPNKVNVVFQLGDQNALPLEGLLSGNMSVTEGGSTLSASESEFKIESENAYDYSPYVALLIDNSQNTETSLTEIIESAKDVISSLPNTSSIQLYTYSSDVSVDQPFTKDPSEVATALDNISLGGSTTNILDAIKEAIFDLDDSVSFGPTRVSPGLIILIASNADASSSADVDEINNLIGNHRLFSASIGSGADSSLTDIINRRGFIANEISELPSRITQIKDQIDLFQKSVYVFSYESMKEGSEEVSASVFTDRTEASDNMNFTFVPSLFFNPDSFEIKTDILRFVANGTPRNGSVLVRKDMRNDSVDFQLFSGFLPSNYNILFTDRDPAIFNDWVNLNADPDKIAINILTADFTLDEGFQSETVSQEVFDKKYMVIRDSRKTKDLSYIQMTLQ